MKTTIGNLRRIISERIRGGVPTSGRHQFKWNEFVKIAKGDDLVEKGETPSIDERFDGAKWYAKSTGLSLLGTGGSRAVFLLNSRSVLKIALNIPGIKQNKQEVSVSRSAQKDIQIARVLNADDDGVWVVSQLVRPMKDDDEFVSLVGYDISEVGEILEDMKKEDDAGMPPKKEDCDLGIWLIWSTVKAGDLALGDIDFLEHWGITADGKLALLDYGFTNAMADMNGKQLMSMFLRVLIIHEDEDLNASKDHQGGTR